MEEDASITREEIERGFVKAGWEVPGSSQYPIVGNAEDLSIVAHEQYAETDDPVFELVDGRQVVSHWVRVIPTPRQAAVLLEEQGGLPRKSEATHTNLSDHIKLEGSSDSRLPLFTDSLRRVLLGNLR